MSRIMCCTRSKGVTKRNVRVLGLYAVLGEYGFVSIVDAPGNDAMARFSIELGVRAGVHITILPAVPVALLGDWSDKPLAELQTSVDLEPPLSEAP